MHSLLIVDGSDAEPESRFKPFVSANDDKAASSTASTAANKALSAFKIKKRRLSSHEPTETVTIADVVSVPDDPIISTREKTKKPIAVAVQKKPVKKMTVPKTTSTCQQKGKDKADMGNVMSTTPSTLSVSDDDHVMEDVDDA